MKYSKLFIALTIMLLTSMVSLAQPETTSPSGDRMTWWRDARFGMFIHWGVYAVPAGEWEGKTNYGEWIRSSARIPQKIYDQFVPRFNPVDFNALDWVRMAKEAGMKYIVITSKHHDGFCMFETKQTNYSIMSTSFRRDPMKELADACRKEGLRLCFYYSIMDWHHPDYLPGRDWERDRTLDGVDFDRYVEYMKAELKELLTNYGDIGVLWFDGEWENTWNEQRGKDLYRYVRSLQPGIIINNRVGAGRLDMEGMTKEGAFGGDFGTPEQQVPATGLPGVDWETCMTMNDHWGYNKNDKNFKSSKELIRMLADIASKGGNYLLNVGPTELGTFPPESVDRLKEIGRWMKINGESIYGTSASPFSDLPWGRCTRRSATGGDILYLHIFKWPEDGKLILSGVLNQAKKAVLLSNRKKRLTVERKEDSLVIILPGTVPDSINTVVTLELKGKLDLTEPPVIKSDFTVLLDSMKVELVSARENVEIRFEFDGSEPTMKSNKYIPGQPIMVKGSCEISARCYRDGKPVSGTSRQQFKRIYPYVAKGVKNLNPGIRFRYYEGSWDSLPKFSGMKPLKEGLLDDFLFIPKKQDEKFGFVYHGYIKVPETDLYAFSTESDDGSCLYIDDKQIVNNDGLHGTREREGIIPLRKGYHKIRVEYFEATGNDNLKVFVRSPGKTKMKLPKDWLFQ